MAFGFGNITQLSNHLLCKKLGLETSNRPKTQALSSMNLKTMLISLAEWLCFQSAGSAQLQVTLCSNTLVLWLVSQEEWILPAGIRVGGQHFSSLCSHTMWGVWQEECENHSVKSLHRNNLNMSSVGWCFESVCFGSNNHLRDEWVISCKLFNFLSLNFSVEGDHKNRVFREIQG